MTDWQAKRANGRASLLVRRLETDIAKFDVMLLLHWDVWDRAQSEQEVRLLLWVIHRAWDILNLVCPRPLWLMKL